MKKNFPIQVLITTLVLTTTACKEPKGDQNATYSNQSQSDSVHPVQNRQIDGQSYQNSFSFSERNPLENNKGNFLQKQREDLLYSRYGYTPQEINHIYIIDFNPYTLVRIEGTILDLIKITRRQESLIFALVKAPNGLYLVNLGPERTIDSVGLAKGDTIFITGSEIRSNGHRILIATEFNYHNRIWQLRNQQGQPLWNHR